MTNKKYTFVPYIFSMVPKLKANMNKFNSASFLGGADFSLFCREVKLGTKGKIFKDTEVPEDGEMPFGICKSAYAEQVLASHWDQCFVSVQQMQIWQLALLEQYLLRVNQLRTTENGYRTHAPLSSWDRTDVTFTWCRDLVLLSTSGFYPPLIRLCHAWLLSCHNPTLSRPSREPSAIFPKATALSNLVCLFLQQSFSIQSRIRLLFEIGTLSFNVWRSQ